MDCSEVRELLSAYYDGELSSDMRAAVAEHLADCDDCRREVEGFRSLTGLAEELHDPQPPAQLWEQLEAQLQAGETAAPRRVGAGPRARWIESPGVRLALAATLLLAAAWFGWRTWRGPVADHEFAVVFGQYLEEFRRDPRAAQQFLLAKFDGQAVHPRQAIDAVGYHPAVANGLPAGYSVESVYVMKMPSCTSVKSLCKRDDGTAFAIFEHDDDQPDWFGDRQATETLCNGAPCSLVELDGPLAVRWRRGQRHMTLIGARDAAEVHQLVAWFDDGR